MDLHETFALACRKIRQLWHSLCVFYTIKWYQSSVLQTEVFQSTSPQILDVSNRTLNSDLKYTRSIMHKTVWNQSTVSTAKRLASLSWYLIASTIDTLQNTINAWLCNCMYIELEVQYTCMYDPKKCWFYISKTCFCFFLTLNCENLAKQSLPLAMF